MDGRVDGKPLSPGSVRRVHGVLHRVLAQAMRWEWIWSNPAAYASPPRVEPVEMRPPSPEEVKRLLEHVALHWPLFHLFLVLAATTGARRGQLLALRLQDVDFDHASLSFQRALVEGLEGPVLAPTKTRRSHRVALDPTTLQLLRARFNEVTSTRPHGLEDAFVFAHDAAGLKPWKPNWVTKQFIAARKGAGLDHFRLHDLRHFMATQMLSAGVAVPIVSARLAHARASTTLKRLRARHPGRRCARCRAHRWHRRCWAGLPTLAGGSVLETWSAEVREAEGGGGAYVARDLARRRSRSVPCSSPSEASPAPGVLGLQGREPELNEPGEPLCDGGRRSRH
jgi:integrase